MKKLTLLIALGNLLVISMLLGCDQNGTTGKDQAVAPTGQESTTDKILSGAKETLDTAAESAKPALDQTVEMAQPAIETAQGLVDQVKQYLAEDKTDLASTVLEQLKGMKASLPESLQNQIDELTKLLDSKESVQTAIQTELPVAVPTM